MTSVPALLFVLWYSSAINGAETPGFSYGEERLYLSFVQNRTDHCTSLHLSLPAPSLGANHIHMLS